MKEFIIKKGKRLRCGITTGTCAAAASTAAAIMLFTNSTVEKVSVKLPGGESINVNVMNPNFEEDGVSCCVKKDAGDDPDVTDGMLICSKVRLDNSGKIKIEGGKGIGRVTQKGLDCPVGEAAINSIPRKMIIENLQMVADEYGYNGGISVVIYAPEGERIAKKTFNPQLGIVGGISIIGTTGIVEPMSERALIESLKVEMKVIKEKGYDKLLAFPGNYAKKFLDENMNMRVENRLKFGNYLGEVLDFAVEFGFKEIFILGHLGKMVKVAGGMMNTHSDNGDFRMETLACYAAYYGAEKDTVRDILSCITTEQALEILIKKGLHKQVICKISERALFYINKRVNNQIKTDLKIYSNIEGILN